MTKVTVGAGVALLCGAATLVLAANAAALTMGGAEAPERRIPVGHVIVTVRLDKAVYRQGEAIRVTVTAKNGLKSDWTVTFPTSQRYDIELWLGTEPGSRKRLWRWSDGRMFADVVGTVKIRAGGELTFRETYPPANPAGPSPTLKPGHYTLVAELAPSVALPGRTAIQTFVVKPIEARKR